MAGLVLAELIAKYGTIGNEVHVGDEEDDGEEGSYWDGDETASTTTINKRSTTGTVRYGKGKKTLAAFGIDGV